MQEITKSFNFPEEPSQEPHFQKDNIKRSHSYSGNHALHPIDETDEFHDPFSDLNLFLSKKIQSTIKRHGSAKKWSSKIQDELLSGILPEFKHKFPHYRLGLTALKKVWDKVSYYYGKVSSQKEAILDDGNLNIHYIVKQNLKDYLSNFQQTDINSITTAHKLAIKLSECIATLQGERPRVDLLTKTIWAVQKHLIKDLPIKYSKNPFEEYDNIDKIIVKILLEKTSKCCYSYKDLVESIKKNFSKLSQYVTEYKSKQIYEHIARQLAEKLYSSLKLLKTLKTKQLSSIENFILFQIETLAHLKAETLVEITQRIMAIYPLMTCLPKNVDLKSKKQAIAYFLSNESLDFPTHTNINDSLAIFLKTEIHFIKRKNLYKSYKDIEAYLLKVLTFSEELPYLQDIDFNDLEVIIWKMYNSFSTDTHKYVDLIENELSTAVLENKNYSFQNIVYMVLHFFQKSKDALKKNSEIDNLNKDDINHKIERWSIQSDMLCRYLHFDPKHEFLQLMQKAWNKKNFSSHIEFVKFITDSYIKKHTILPFGLKGLEKRIWIFYKFFWYNQLSEPYETTLSRFIKWHVKDTHTKSPKATTDEKLAILERKILEALPITPYTKDELKQALNCSD